MHSRELSRRVPTRSRAALNASATHSLPVSHVSLSARIPNWKISSPRTNWLRAMVAGLTLICFVGPACRESPDSRAILVLRSTSGENDARLDSIRQLQASGREAILRAKPELIQALDNSAPRIQRAAEEALTPVGSDVANDLIKLDGDTHRRASALRILSRAIVDNAIVDQVVAESGNGDYTMRIHSCKLLGALAVKNDSALTQLSELIADHDPLIRIAAIDEVSELSPARGAQLSSALARALDDPVLNVREAACVGLGGMGPSAVQARTALEQLGRGQDSHLAQLARIAVSAVSGSASDRQRVQ